MTTSPRTRSVTRKRRDRAFTLIELLMVMVVIGIAFGLALPMMGDSKELRLQAAARLLAADIELTQNESITHGDDPRLIKFDTGDDEYWIAAVSDPATPITDPVRQEPFLVAFGTGRASGCADVTIQSISLGGDDELRFNAYGAPDQTANADIVLACGPATMTVRVTPGTGEVTIP